MSGGTSLFYEFGPFRLNRSERILTSGGEVVPLTPKAMELLLVLVQNGGRLLEREELIGKLWPGTFVEEGNLSHHIFCLRKALRDEEGAAGRYIQTVPRRGYCFVAPIRCGNCLPEPPVPGVAVSADKASDISRDANPRPILWIAVGFAVVAVAAVGGFLLRPGTKPAAATFTQLTDTLSPVSFPSLSPDGGSVLYAGGTPGNLDIYLLRVGGTNPINLTRDSPSSDTHPAFSPDGRRIAFRSERKGGGIFVMGATGESPRRVSDFGYNPAWSPDGREIVFATENTDGPSLQYGSRLWRMDAESGEKRAVSDRNAVQPHWSPHGHRIAYWAQSGGFRDIWTMTADGTDPVPVTNDSYVDWNPVWSPDGEYLYFCSDRAGSMSPWRVRIDEKSGKRLSELEPEITPASWAGFLSFTRDGQQMAYLHRALTANIHKIGFDSARGAVITDPVAITHGSGEAVTPDVSGAGNLIVFKKVSNQEDLFLVGSERAGLRQLTYDAAFDRWPRWSPDAKRIAFHSNRGGKFEIWMIDTGSGAARQLTTTVGEAMQPVWSPDGTRLAFSVANAGTSVFEVDKPWTKQSPEILPQWSGGGWFQAMSWSLDGRMLAGSWPLAPAGAKGILIYSFESRRYHRLTDFGDWPVWLSDNRRLLYHSEGKIYLVDSASQRTREVFSPQSPYSIHRAFAVSRDNKAIYISLGHERADIWLSRLR